MKHIFLITVAIVVIILSAVVFKTTYLSQKSEEVPHNLSVVASFYPLYYFASQIGKEYITLTNITPAGAEPHEYEPTTKDIMLISSADLVIINGAGLEPWAEKIPNAHILAVSEPIASRTISEDHEQKRDPHTWLDPVLAQQIVKEITNALKLADPEHADYFSHNSQQLIDRLILLDQEFKAVLASCPIHSVITSHAAFGYLADRYHFTQIAISGVSPEEEPSAQEMGEIARLAKKNNIQYIFFETLVSPRLAETIASEAHAQTLVFNPLEGLTEQERTEEEDYFTIQTQNLQNLQKAMACK